MRAYGELEPKLFVVVLRLVHVTDADTDVIDAVPLTQKSLGRNRRGLSR
jgi:hypothetical protein